MAGLMRYYAERNKLCSGEKMVYKLLAFYSA